MFTFTQPFVHIDTPLANGYSPSQLLFNRPMNSMGILTNDQVDVARLKEFEKTQRSKQAANYNARFATREREVQSDLGKEWLLENLGRHQLRPL